MKKVAIGGGQGFWGDSPDAAIHMTVYYTHLDVYKRQDYVFCTEAWRTSDFRICGI